MSATIPPRIPPTSGCLITSLEAELFPPKAAICQSIFVQGLFSQRIGLSNSHALDNARLAQFMRENEHVLETEEVDERRLPLFGICGVVGSDLRKALELYLRPKGDLGKPTYLSSLSPQENLRLGKGYEKLSEEERWHRFEEVAGTEFIKHVDRATRYFKKHSQAVVPRIRERGFFDSARRALSALDRDRLPPTSQSIMDAMIEAMENWNPQDGYQSRERLHEAIYGMKTPPRIWKGQAQRVSYDISQASTREGWRFLVDALSNAHHADAHGLNVVTTPDLRVPKNLRKALYVESEQRRRDQTELELPATVYTDHLDLQFVISLRRKREFWNSLEAMDNAQDDSAFREHLKLISEEFAEYLSGEKNRPDLVRINRAKILTTYADVFLAFATLGAVIGALPYELSAGSLGLLKVIVPAGASAGAAVHVAINGFFSSQQTENPDFRNFMTNLGKAGGSLFEG